MGNDALSNCLERVGFTHALGFGAAFFHCFAFSYYFTALLKVKFPHHLQAWHSYLAGSFSLIGSQIFTYLATAYLSSGIIALMFGLTPIMAGLIGRFVFQLHLARIQWIGMTVSILGLGIICFGGETQHVHPLDIVLMLFSVLSYTVSIFWLKKINAQVEPVAQATGSILVSTIAALCIVPFIWSYMPTSLPSLKSIVALLYTVIMASLIAMFCYFKLVQNIQATTLSLTTVMTPMIALLIGALLNQEAMSIMVFLGALVLLSGLVLYFYRDLKASRALARKIKTPS